MSPYVLILLNDLLTLFKYILSFPGHDFTDSHFHLPVKLLFNEDVVTHLHLFLQKRKIPNNSYLNRPKK